MEPKDKKMEKNIAMDYDTFLKKKEKRRQQMSHGDHHSMGKDANHMKKKGGTAPRQKNIRYDWYDEDEDYDEEF